MRKDWEGEDGISLFVLLELSFLSLSVLTILHSTRYAECTGLFLLH